MKKWNIKPRSCWEWNFVGVNTVSEIHDTRRVNSHLSFIFVVVFFVIFHRCASPDRSTTTLNIPTFTFFLFFSLNLNLASLAQCAIFSLCVNAARNVHSSVMRRQSSPSHVVRVGGPPLSRPTNELIKANLHTITSKRDGRWNVWARREKSELGREKHHAELFRGFSSTRRTYTCVGHFKNRHNNDRPRREWEIFLK